MELAQKAMGEARNSGARSVRSVNCQSVVSFAVCERVVGQCEAALGYTDDLRRMSQLCGPSLSSKANCRQKPLNYAGCSFIYPLCCAGIVDAAEVARSYSNVALCLAYASQLGKAEEVAATGAAIEVMPGLREPKAAAVHETVAKLARWEREEGLSFNEGMARLQQQDDWGETGRAAEAAKKETMSRVTDEDTAAAAAAAATGL